MTVVQINATCATGSTGRICQQISRELTAQGIENYILYSVGKTALSNAVSCAKEGEIRAQAFKSRLFGNYGLNSRGQTRRMIAWLEKWKPDIVHLHNIHGHDCNLELLFSYFRIHKTKLFWTFHDCWAFTGYCPHFIYVQCDQWKTGCRNCPQRGQFSWLFDRSAMLYQKKKELFSGLDLTIITPSQWMAQCVEKSFLYMYPIQVRYNGIDATVFAPTDSDFRVRYGIAKEKKLILGVAFGWGRKKGLDVFLELDQRLPTDQYQIVLVGTDSRIAAQLPENILPICRTQNQHELAEIYTAADLFVNPTLEDTFPTVNLEALACGTPVLTFRTGGSPEALDETCGSVVDWGDVDSLQEEIIRICRDKPYSPQACRKRAEQFESVARYKESIALYERNAYSRTENHGTGNPECIS